MKKLILKILEENKGTPISGGELARQLNVSRNAVWKNINSLKKEGYKIISLKNSGYIFSNDNDRLSELEIKKYLKARVLGSKIDIRQTVNSTNNELKTVKNNQNIENGYTLLSEEQTDGRGRRGRSFLSEKGQGLYMSIYFKPEAEFKDFTLITIAAAISVCKAVESFSPSISPKIKWVNDIFIGDKKFCGILTEVVFNAEENTADSIITGIGINTGSLPECLQEFACTLSDFISQAAIRNELAAKILNEFEQNLIDLQKNSSDIIKEYKSRLFILNKHVIANNFKEKIIIKAIDIDNKGRLKAEIIDGKNKGKIITLSSAEVSLLPCEKYLYTN